jgi:ABC-type multidrug transport system ATPase subunit
MVYVCPHQPAWCCLAVADSVLLLLLQVGLSDKLPCLAGELSGGQRRKLSVAVAFLGDPKGESM